MKALKAVAKELYLAVVYFLSADQSQYGWYIEDLENRFLQGQDKYPKTVAALYNLLANLKQDPGNMMRAIGRVNDGISFTNFTSKEEAMA